MKLEINTLQYININLYEKSKKKYVRKILYVPQILLNDTDLQDRGPRSSFLFIRGLE